MHTVGDNDILESDTESMGRDNSLRNYNIIIILQTLQNSLNRMLL